jgi:hypothetical protein
MARYMLMFCPISILASFSNTRVKERAPVKPFSMDPNRLCGSSLNTPLKDPDPEKYSWCAHTNATDKSPRVHLYVLPQGLSHGALTLKPQRPSAQVLNAPQLMCAHCACASLALTASLFSHTRRQTHSHRRRSS